jgi:hypothetical protein
MIVMGTVRCLTLSFFLGCSFAMGMGLVMLVIFFWGEFNTKLVTACLNLCL